MKKLVAIVLCFAFAALVFSGCRGSVPDQDVNDRYTEPTTGMTTPSMPSEPTTGYADPSVPATDGGNDSANGDSAGSANGGAGSTNGGSGVDGADGSDGAGGAGAGARGSGSTMGRG